MKTLTPEQKERFERDGFLIYGQVLSTDELAEIREHIDALASGDSPEAAKVGIRLEAAAQTGALSNVAQRDRVWQIMGATRYDPVLAQHAKKKLVLDIVQDLLDTDSVRLFTDQTLMKPAYHGSPVSWHQDSAYWTNLPAALVSCWTALDDVTVDNGCMKMIPGSHKWGVVEHRRDVFLHAQGFNEADAQPIVMPAGWCSFHHSLTIHGSGPNNTPNRRRGFITAYVSGDATWLGDPAKKPEMPLLRGAGVDS